MLNTLFLTVNDAYEMFGFSKDFITYLTEQLPGGHKCRTYKFQHHLPSINDDDEVIFCFLYVKKDESTNLSDELKNCCGCFFTLCSKN